MEIWLCSIQIAFFLVFLKIYIFNSCKIDDMSQSILFICARSAKENLLNNLFNYRYNYENNHLYILKKYTSKYIYNFNHLHGKRTDNVTFSPEVIEFMIDHSNQHS